MRDNGDVVRFIVGTARPTLRGLGRLPSRRVRSVLAGERGRYSKGTRVFEEIAALLGATRRQAPQLTGRSSPEIQALLLGLLTDARRPRTRAANGAAGLGQLAQLGREPHNHNPGSYG
jgi:hypothetical protein